MSAFTDIFIFDVQYEPISVTLYDPICAVKTALTLLGAVKVKEVEV